MTVKLLLLLLQYQAVADMLQQPPRFTRGLQLLLRTPCNTALLD
jgi:hypothetical protein